MVGQKNVCLNCGKLGHQLKSCIEPVNSYGIICFNISQELKIKNLNIETFFYNKFLDLSEFNYSNLNNIKYIPYFYDKIKFLMIRRKNSLNYIDFIRGKYDETNKDNIYKIFNLMTKNEIDNIKTKEFDNLWNELWKNTATNKKYMKEYHNSKQKFNLLKSNNFFNYSNIDQYIDPEWGFPKGRKNNYQNTETNLDCAIREFNEETNIDLDNLLILERLNYLEEEYIGTNSVKYKHNYFLASSEHDNIFEVESYIDNHEVGEIGWFTISEGIEKIRPYYTEKIKLIHQTYFFIINLIINILETNNNYIIE